MSSSFKPPESPFEPPPFPYRFLSSPVKYIAQTLYKAVLYIRGTPRLDTSSGPVIRLVCISDTHTNKPDGLPTGDVLIHAGDLTNNGTVAEIQDQIDWLSTLPFKHKLVICGNHDSAFSLSDSSLLNGHRTVTLTRKGFFDPRSRRNEESDKSIDWKGVHYLQHSSLKLEFTDSANRQLSFYGAPQIPRCGGKEFAFQYRRTDDAWSDTVPLETDVLITHSPPRYHLDLPAGLGCEFLLQEVWSVRPKVHVFGHVHAGYGREYLAWNYAQRIYEKLSARKEKGVVRDVIAASAWMGIIRLAFFGALDILWSRVWKGTGRGTILVNSSLMYRSTGTLRNPAHVVDI